MEIKRVGVVGCGIMGSGIAQVCAQAGYDVMVSEMDDELLKKGLASINVRLAKRVDKGKLSQHDMDDALTRIKGTTNTQEFNNCYLMIEAAPDSMEVKKKVFSELDTICSRHAVLTTNTSSQSIIDIAMTTKRPDKVLGLHFFNPAPAIKLLEVVKSIATSDEILEIGKEFGRSLGKSVVVAPDRPGFLVNSLMSPWRLNAIRMLEARIATREDIDTAIKLGANMPMGPLEVADLIGLDTILEGASTMYREYNDPKYAPPLLLKKMVAAGWLGRKTGKGFYEYETDE